MKQAIFEKISTSTLRQRIAAKLREAILEGVLTQGEKLVERKLARQLGCSLTAVREALVQLETEGFITKTPNSSTHVTLFSPTEVKNSFALRRLLEGYAMVEAARLATPQQLQDLQSRYLEMVDAAKNGNHALYLQKDIAWHEAIWELAHNEYLTVALRRIIQPQFTYSEIKLNSGNAVDLLQDAYSHLPLLEAILSRDPDRCRKALEDVLDGWLEVWRAWQTSRKENHEGNTLPAADLTS